MSLRTKHTKHQKLYMSTGNFSSMSLGSYSIPKMSTGASALPITAVTVNKSLLTPLNVDIDPTIQAVRNQEKEQIKGLNNRFAAYIDKVRFLEQQNKMLETKWNLLQSQTAATSNIEPMLKSYIASLQRQLEMIENGRHKLDMENMSMHNQVEEYKTQYEKEINTRNDAENQFVLLKKDVDTGYMSKTELEDSVSIINDEVAFFKSLYDMEIRELQNSLKETSVVVEMDNARALNMDQIVADVKAQYEGIAARSREEAESWYKTKFDQVSAEANQYGNELHSSKAAISELNRMIIRVRNEIEAAKTQRASVESQINEAEVCGDKAVKDARDRIRELEMALQKAKQNMARQVKEYQELMNLKLALDIEISTYKKLLEGEEARLGHDSIVNIQTVPGKTVSTTKHQRRKSGPLYIKTVETSDRSYN